MNLQMSHCLIITILLNYINSSSSDQYSDESPCYLEPTLLQEMASYKNNIYTIMHEILKNGYGHKMYKDYTDFIYRYGARPSGSDNLERSIDHMINLTVANGLNDVTTEEVYVPHWIRGHESAKMIKPYERNIKILGFGGSVSTPPAGILAEAIVISSFEELEHAKDDTIKGKIVVFDQEYTNYDETVAYRSYGALNAARKGAVATLVKSITPFSIYSPHTGAQYYDINVTRIPTAAITLEDASFLRRVQNNTLPGQKIILHIKMKNKIEIKKSRNTIVDLKGKEKPEKLVIVSGHIDSWDVGTGAMDDGGGMMISWFVPVILNKLNFKPKRTVRAILWTSNEPGSVGAQAYIDRHLKELDNINFMMESDQGTFKPLGLDVVGSSMASCIISEILNQFNYINTMTKTGSPGSDIKLFSKQGVPTATLLNDNQAYFWFHHSEGDTLNVQDESDVLKCAAFWAAISYTIADLSVDIPRS